MHRILAQEPGGGLLPDWLADAPPWLQVIALVLALIGTLAGGLGIATVGVWGPALADRIRGRSTPAAPPETGSSGGPAVSPTTSSGPALQQYDAQAELITGLVQRLEKSLVAAEDEADRLRDRLELLVNQLAEARIEIGRLTYQRDLLLQQRVEPRPPAS